MSLTYGVITEFLLQYPVERFVLRLYPQLSLSWKLNEPKEPRLEIPDIGVLSANVMLQDAPRG